MSTSNIYDTANQLERDLRALPAYTKIKEAFEAIEQNEASKALFAEYKEAIQTFQAKQMAGAQLEESEIQGFQALSERVMADDNIRSLMESEQQISQVMTDINAIITKPLQELYEGR